MNSLITKFKTEGATYPQISSPLSHKLVNSNKFLGPVK